MPEYDVHFILSQNLRYLRLENNLTQHKVADYLNISRSAYAYYESAASLPSCQSLLRLSSLYHVSIDELLKTKMAASRSAKRFSACDKA